MDQHISKNCAKALETVIGSNKFIYTSYSSFLSRIITNSKYFSYSWHVTSYSLPQGWGWKLCLTCFTSKWENETRPFFIEEGGMRILSKCRRYLSVKFVVCFLTKSPLFYTWSNTVVIAESSWSNSTNCCPHCVHYSIEIMEGKWWRWRLLFICMSPSSITIRYLLDLKFIKMVIDFNRFWIRIF